MFLRFGVFIRANQSIFHFDNRLFCVLDNVAKAPASRRIDFGHAYRREFEMRLLAHRVPSGNRQFVCRSRMPIIHIVPIAIMEGNENVAPQNVADADSAFDLSSAGRNAHNVALFQLQILRVKLIEFHKHIRCGVVKFL